MLNLFRKKSRPVFNVSDFAKTRCVICDHAIRKQRPILCVTFNMDNECWQFHCGHEDHGSTNFRMITLRNAIRIDPTITDALQLPFDVAAGRQEINAKWLPFRKDYEES